MAGVNVGTAYLEIIPSAKGFAGKLQAEVGGDMAKTSERAGKESGGRFRSGFSSGLGKLAGAAGGFFAVSKAVDFFKSANDEARESQKVGAQTANVLKSTGGAAGVTAKQIGSLATAISNKVGVDDEAIQSGENLLLTFTNVRNEAGKGNDVFNQATGLMTDMSKALGQDMKSSAIQLGKALNDPIKGVTALQRVGVSFTTQQKAVNKALVEGGPANALMAMGLVDSTTAFNAAIKAQGGDVNKAIAVLTKGLTPAQQKYFKHLEEGGHTVEAQRKILGELTKEFGGSAAAQATASEKAAVAWGNLKEQIGTALLPVIDNLANFLNAKVIPAISGFITQMQSGHGAGGRFAGVLSNVVDAAKRVGAVVMSVGGFLLRHMAIVKAVALAWVAWRVAAIAYNVVQMVSLARLKMQTEGTIENAVVTRAAAVASKVWAAGQWLLNAALSANPIALVVIAIAALVAGLIIAYKHSETFRNIVNGAFHAVVAAGKFMWSVLKGYFKFIIDAFLTVASAIVHGAAKAFGWVPGIGPKLKSAAKAFDDFRNRVNSSLDGIHDKNVKVTVGIYGTQAAVKLATQGQGGAGKVSVQMRAAGGPVKAGMPYVVGERRAELFVPEQNGRIIPRIDSAAAMRSTALPPVHVYVSLDGKPVRAMVRAEMDADRRYEASRPVRHG